MEMQIAQGPLAPIWEKVQNGTRLSHEDGVAMYHSPHLNQLGFMANWVKEKMYGHKVTYIINRHINYSNICAISCAFCAFGKNSKSADGYTFRLEEIFERAGEAHRMGASELHMVGGLHPDLPFSFYEEMLEGIHTCYPELFLKAFTAVEIEFFADKFGFTIPETLEKLKAKGLQGLTGGGAEILVDRVRDIICKPKLEDVGWLGVHRIAHTMGLPSTSTMLYGHVETLEERVVHMLKIRELQDETNGFTTFVPLCFHPENTRLEQKVALPGGQEDLRNLAIARLLMDNMPHIKSYWIMTGLKVAQASLDYGVSDFDGTVVEEKITHMAGAKSPQHVPGQELVEAIAGAGRTPIRRDTVYNELPPLSAVSV